MRDECIKSLSDEALDSKVRALAKQEREILVDVLKHLREVNRRKLFAKFKYKSLAAYVEHHLGYSYDQAWRRVEATKLLKEIPQLESKISAGSLTLTNIGLASTVFKDQLKTNGYLMPNEKLSLLVELENKTKREAEKHIAAQFGKDVLVRESVKAVTKTKSLLSIPVDDSLLDKIENLKGLWAHAKPFLSTEELLMMLCDLGLQRWNPSQQKSSSHKTKNELTQSKDFAPARNVKMAANRVGPEKIASKNLVPDEVKKSITRIVHKRYIPTTIRSAVWKRDKGACTNCDSKRGLEFDHIVPYAKGGLTTITNLRLLCRNCNQRAAVEQFGVEKMNSYTS